MDTGKYLLASFVALAGCDMSKAPTEDTINPITQQKIHACQKLVAGVIAREEQQIAHSGGVNVEFLGTTEAVQIQRDLEKPEQLYSIKAVRQSDGVIHNYSMGNGIGGEESKGIDGIVIANTEIALGPVVESGNDKDGSPKKVPTCTYKNGKYSVDISSNHRDYRYTILNQGLDIN